MSGGSSSGSAAAVLPAPVRVERAAGELVFAVLPAPPVEIEAALAALAPLLPTDDHLVAWIPPRGASFAGVGAAARSSCATPEAARAAASALLDRVRAGEGPREGAPGPRLFCALPFAAEAERSGPWGALGGGLLLLPRLLYLREGERCFVAVAGPDDEGSLRALLERAGSALSRAAKRHEPGHLPALVDRQELPRERWGSILGEILHGIDAHRFEKVVAARRAALRFDAPLDPLDVLARLAPVAEGTTRFLLRADGRTFVGATPERLATRQGDRVLTEALAGTISRSIEDGEAALLGSSKDRAEQDLVVREVVRRLQPLCDALDVPSAPRARALRHIVHLHTPIEGHLRAATHVLDLVAVLHPTPAVCGLPSDEARRFIVEREGAGRGLYAGPIGWVDEGGDGDFAVALRSAVLEGDRAFLWVGAGIVAGSVPEREYEETALKQRPMLQALGLGQEGP